MNNRLKSLSFYFGLAPLFPACWKKESITEPHQWHLRQAMVFFFFQKIIFLAIILIWVVFKQIIAYYFPEAIEKYMFFNVFIVDFLLILLIFIFLLFWSLAIFRVIKNKTSRLPIVNRLSEKKRIVTIGFCWNCIILFLFVTLLLVLIHSGYLAQNPDNLAQVYMLYDDMGLFPRWIYTTLFYQMSVVTQAKWGAGNVKVEPITHTSLENALDNGKVIFLSVHGALSTNDFAGSFFYFDETRANGFVVGPKQIAKIGFGTNLKYVYLAACNSGALASEWEQVFAPVKIRTFNRISTYPDHLYWLFVQGPAILKKL